MKEILLNIIYIIITTAGSALIAFLCTLLKTKIAEITAKIKNDRIVNYIDSAEDAVITAVLTVSQTYVDALKKDGGFTKAAQVEAKNKAIEIATTLINEDIKEAIASVYGDFSLWLTSKIEENVKINK